MSDIITTTITIRNLEWLQEKVKQLQNKAKKLGFTPVTIDCVNSYRKDEWVNQIKVSNLYHDVTLTYQIIKIEGWQFIAKIDGKENMIYCAPLQILPPEQLHYDMNCEHCNINRERFTVYVLRNEAGLYKRVGSSCLAKYLGIDAAHVLLMADIFSDITELEDDDNLQSYSGIYEYNLRQIFSVTKFVLRRCGYTSITKAKEAGTVSTASVVTNIITELSESSSHWQMDSTTKLAADYKADNTDYGTLFDDCIQWMLSLENSQESYELNLYNIANNGYCTFKSFGTAVSALPRFESISAKRKEKQLSLQSSKSDFYGKVGEKFTAKAPLIAQCTFVSREYDSGLYVNGRYISSVKQTYVLTDTNGNLFVLHADAHKFKQGDKVSLTGVIKGHEISKYSGEKQTVLSNCRIKILET